jgi:transcriptional regulator with XRE-family HTH domain
MSDGFVVRGASVLEQSGGFSGPLDVHVEGVVVGAVGPGLSAAAHSLVLTGRWLIPGVFACLARIGLSTLRRRRSEAARRGAGSAFAALPTHDAGTLTGSTAIAEAAGTIARATDANDVRCLSPRLMSATPQPELGQRIREARLAARRSLAEVAEATDISQSFLSMVENGNSDMSIGRLLRLTQYYGIEIADVVRGPDEVSEDVVHPDERRSLISAAEGLEIEFLAEAHHPLRPLLVTFDPGGGMVEPVRNSGDAFLYLLSGEIAIEVDQDEPFALREGDSVYLPGDRPRLYRNNSTEPALLLSVVLRQDVVGPAVTAGAKSVR